jgi:hypothetical protein
MMRGRHVKIPELNLPVAGCPDITLQSIACRFRPSQVKCHYFLTFVIGVREEGSPVQGSRFPVSRCCVFHLRKMSEPLFYDGCR